VRFVYTPENGESQSWPYDPMKMLSVELEAIEDRTGMTFMEWGEALTNGSVKALHALLWVYLKRSDPTLEWGDVSFTMAEVDIETDEMDAAEADEADAEDPKA
jgi:hypothetical protein